MPRRPAIQLAIPQPCHEAWDQMTPATAGRHCASCDKVVVDFTRMTDGEVEAWFGARVGQQVCGKYRPDQLGRPIRSNNIAASSHSAYLLALSMLVAACSTGTSDRTINQPAPRGEARLLPPTTVRGRIYNPQTGQPVAALVGIEGDTVHTLTDSTGHFALHLPARGADQQLLALSLEAPLYSTSAAAIDGIEIPLAYDAESQPPLGQTRVDTITPQGRRWAVSKSLLRRWMAPPPPPHKLISTVRFVPPAEAD